MRAVPALLLLLLLPLLSCGPGPEPTCWVVKQVRSAGGEDCTERMECEPEWLVEGDEAEGEPDRCDLAEYYAGIGREPATTIRDCEMLVECSGPEVCGQVCWAANGF